jgi:hypothetical protein
MKLMTLFEKSRWDAVWPNLLKLYPDQEASLADYERVYWNLLSASAADTTLHIVIKYVPKEGKYGGYWDVSAQNMEDLEIYAIEFRPWEEWLGMEIDLETLNTLAPLDIICHSLWEMTFIGYDQDEIKQKWNEVLQAKDEMSDARHLSSWEEFLEDMDFPENDDVQAD